VGKTVVDAGASPNFDFDWFFRLVCAVSSLLSTAPSSSRSSFTVLYTGVELGGIVVVLPASVSVGCDWPIVLPLLAVSSTFSGSSLSMFVHVRVSVKDVAMRPKANGVVGLLGRFLVTIERPSGKTIAIPLT